MPPHPSSLHDASSADNPSGRTIPIWYDHASVAPRAVLTEDAQADVCVVGAGIAGLTSAYLLAKSGKSVIVLDEKPVGGGETGRTSAHLASALDDRFHVMEQSHGLDAVRLMYEGHATAINRIEEIVRDEAIDCDFARLDGFLFAGEGVDEKTLEEEFNAASRAGVEGVELIRSPLSFGPDGGRCIRFPGQARFHPLRYLAQLAAVLDRLGVRIFIGNRVTDLSGNGPVDAKLDSGRMVHASAGIAATNVPTPINNWMGIYTKEAAYRTYMIGMEVPADRVPDALYWDMEDPYHYVRLERERDRCILLVGGEDHKTGQEQKTQAEAFDRLERWARRWFPGVTNVTHRWSGQVSEPEDGLGYAGRVPTHGNQACYAITGDSGMGLTHGTLGAMIVTDLILPRANRWEALYSPARKPWSAIGAFVKENVNAAAQLTDHVKGSDVANETEIERGSGAVMRDGVSLVAVYRDEEGELHRTSAVCPHLKCVVRWNGVERSWDCPCHGSRFDCHGKLIIGPAISDLPPHASDKA